MDNVTVTYGPLGSDLNVRAFEAGTTLDEVPGVYVGELDGKQLWHEVFVNGAAVGVNSYGRTELRNGDTVLIMPQIKAG